VTTRNDGKRCRAWFKVEELLSLNLIPQTHLDCVIDVGASPGGWSERLHDHANEIVAIDPGLLDEAVLALPRITHLQCKVQDEQVFQHLQNKSIDVLLCDMNVQAEDGLEMIKTLFPLVKSKGTLIFTVKLMKRYSERALASILQRCTETLSSQFEDIRMKWIFSNTICERTIIAMKK